MLSWLLRGKTHSHYKRSVETLMKPLNINTLQIEFYAFPGIQILALKNLTVTMPTEILNAEILYAGSGPESSSASVKQLFNGEFDEEV